MRQGLYCVYDSKMSLYSMPFFSPSDAAAVRTFSDALNQPETMLCKHPEDFALIRLCDVEDSDGLVTVPAAPVCCYQGRSHVKEK